ncbi:lipopolysaccharide-induced tumor necrosis factor-alpha factor [Microdochium nivale]|nr:lipopolysaccharide-induced tumor necrosis factor-alpha factor [Microdochium nivale]
MSTVAHDAPPSYTASSTAPQADGQKQSSNPFHSELSVDTSNELPTHRQQLPVIDDGGLPEVVVMHETIDMNHHKSHHPSHSVEPVVSSPTLSTPTSPAPVLVPSGQANLASLTVTPLHLLGDQPDTVDCPFCQTQTMTKIKKTPSIMTHVVATGLLFTTGVGVGVPYATKWKSHVSHFCANCDKKVAYRRRGQKEMQALGTPKHMREESRYPVAT